MTSMNPHRRGSPPVDTGKLHRDPAGASPASILVVDRDGFVVEASGWEPFAGRDPRGGRLPDYRELIHPDDREAALAEISAGISERREVSVECRVWRRTEGEYRLVLARGLPVRDGGGGVREWVVVVEDPTEHRRAESDRDRARYRLSLLGEASRRLTSSLDYGTTLEQVARLAVPRFADLCLVDITGQSSPARRLVVSRLGPEREELARELVRRYQGVEIPSGGLAGMVRAGEPVLVREVEDSWLYDTARADGNLDELVKLDLGSVLISPLIVRGRVFGALSFATDRASGRRYDEEDLRLAEALARRAAQAIEKARLYDRQRHTAQTLQKSLLPPSLPEIPGVEAAARYRPAGDAPGTPYDADYEVGGDFYDLSPTPAGWVIVMGDVMGKGVEAAAFTAMARYTLRTAAMQGDDPCSVLRTLNDAILNQREQNSRERFCTAAYGLLNPTDSGGASLEVCRAGHPAPLILRENGAVEEAGVPGQPVGAFPGTQFETRTTRLAPGEAAIFYTDGITDARNAEGELFGEERLKDLLSNCLGLDAESIADTVEQGVIDFQGCQNARDDVAMMVLRVASQEVN